MDQGRPDAGNPVECSYAAERTVNLAIRHDPASEPRADAGEAS